jgi:hypothetical protein
MSGIDAGRRGVDRDQGRLAIAVDYDEALLPVTDGQDEIVGVELADHDVVLDQFVLELGSSRTQ